MSKLDAKFKYNEESINLQDMMDQIKSINEQLEQIKKESRISENVPINTYENLEIFQKKVF